MAEPDIEGDANNRAGNQMDDNQISDTQRAHARRNAFADEIHRRTGIDDGMIRDLVHAFYAKARKDALIGPVFEARVEDWSRHLPRMCAFWSSVVLMSGQYHGRPMQAHAPLAIDGSHFDRWLALFAETAREVCPPAAAELFIEKSKLIATSLELGIASYRGQNVAKGERLPPPPC